MREALGFLTIVGGARPPDRRALPWFPVVGAVAGAAVGGLWWAAGRWWSAAAAAAIAVTADLVLTGAIHFDGLADSADGLLPHLDRSRRLEVMAAPDVGAFGMVVVVTVVLLRWSALASQPRIWTSVAALWCLSRALMATAIRALPYARAEGLASGFSGGRAIVPALIGLGLSAALLSSGESAPRAAAALAAAAVGGILPLALARRRLGGYTGDVLGAAGVIAETAGLLALAAGR